MASSDCGWLEASVNNTLLATFDDEGDIVNENQVTSPTPYRLHLGIDVGG
jgi:hypothetical protein